MSLFHTLSHWLDLNYCLDVIEYDEDGNRWSGLECQGCGRVSNRKMRTKSQLAIEKMIASFVTTGILDSFGEEKNVAKLFRNGASIESGGTVKFKRPTSYKNLSSDGEALK